MTIDDYTAQFGIPEHLWFEQNADGLVTAHLRSSASEAVVSTIGAQVLRYRPVEQSQDLLYLSPTSVMRAGKSMRGGIPICWPWFGPDPEGQGRPAHGIARINEWTPRSSALLDDGRVSLVLGLDDDEQTRAIWPHAFKLRLRLIVGASLQLELTTTNQDDQAVVITQALHTYFQIGDVAQCEVLGLYGVNYIDKLDDALQKTQDTALKIDRPLDRIYLEAGNKLSLLDASLQRRILIEPSGSSSTVVWSPWEEGAKQFADLPDEDYRRMLCVETCNAATDYIELAAGQSHTLSVEYRVAPA